MCDFDNFHDIMARKKTNIEKQLDITVQLKREKGKMRAKGFF